MTLYDLEIGMLVKTRDGAFSLVMPYDDGCNFYFMDLDSGWLELKYYTEDMIHTFDDQFDIMEVYGIPETPWTTSCNEKDIVKGRKLLWERESLLSFSQLEAVNKLEELLGCKVRIY